MNPTELGDITAYTLAALAGIAIILGDWHDWF